MNLIELKDRIAVHLSDTDKREITDPELEVFVNSAVDDARAEDILIPIEDAESIILTATTYQYAIPKDFAYVDTIKIANEDFAFAYANLATLFVETGALVDESGNVDAAVTEFNVDTTGDVNIGTDVLAVNDIIVIISTADDALEAMRITAMDQGDPASATETALTVERAVFGTTAATHPDDDPIYKQIKETTAIEFEKTLPHVYWRIGNEVENPTLHIDSRIFSVDAGRQLQLIGQKRPRTYSNDYDTIDSGLESFLRERGLAYAARNALTGSSQLAQARAKIADHAFSNSEEILKRLPPQKHRIRPRSIYVQGR